MLCYRFTLAGVEDFHHPFAGPDAHLLMDQGIRNGIEVFLEIDVVVNVDPGHFTGGILIGLVWQWMQGGFVQFLKQFQPRFLQLFHLAIIEILQQWMDRPVQLCQAEKGAIA